MGYRSLRECVDDLERHQQLVRISSEVDPNLEVAEIQRRVSAAGGPALLFERVKGTPFPMVSNLFGTLERAHFMFRDSLDPIRRLVEVKVDPSRLMRQPFRYLGVAWTASRMLPRAVASGPILQGGTTRIGELPQLKSWPDDGGAFITLPQVYTQDPQRPVPMQSNLGMYRIQLSGNDYVPDQEVGLHYQLHRGIGVHQQAAQQRGERLPVSIFVGGPPAMTLAAVMPLPEGLSELTFAGALNRRRVPMIAGPAGMLHADADFCIVGEMDPNRTRPEGPFGDHLGYYSLTHDYPVMDVKAVYHRRDAIWPFTVVGRPPQEDSIFGALIHELTGPVIPSVIPGVTEVHAVDATGVHPLLLAAGSERYTPYAPLRAPQELLTQANAILGQGQMSLAKYLFIVDGAGEGRPALEDVGALLQYLLERFDPRRDLHFQTRTTIDTLDYSGSGLNRGSKVVIAAVGEKLRELPRGLAPELRLPEGFAEPRLCLPGVLALRAPAFAADDQGRDVAGARLAAQIGEDHPLRAYPLIVLCDDSEFTARSLDNFLWVTFTRSSPARDLEGVGAAVVDKHWGCVGPLIIDARIKPGHAPPLVEDRDVTARVDTLAAPGGPLHGLY